LVPRAWVSFAYIFSITARLPKSTQTFLMFHIVYFNNIKRNSGHLSWTHGDPSACGLNLRLLMFVPWIVMPPFRTLFVSIILSRCMMNSYDKIGFPRLVLNHCPNSLFTALRFHWYSSADLPILILLHETVKLPMWLCGLWSQRPFGSSQVHKRVEDLLAISSHYYLLSGTSVTMKAGLLISQILSVCPWSLYVSIFSIIFLIWLIKVLLCCYILLHFVSLVLLPKFVRCGVFIHTHTAHDVLWDKIQNSNH